MFEKNGYFDPNQCCQSMPINAKGMTMVPLSITAITPASLNKLKRLRSIRVLVVCAAALLISACSSKLKDEYDFRPYIASWVGKNCAGKNKQYNCEMGDGMFASGTYDGDDFVYGIAYYDANSKKRVVYVKVAAAKPYTRTIVGDESFEEKADDDG